VISLFDKPMLVYRVIVKRSFLLLTAITLIGQCFADEGVMEGILSAKGDSWIEVVDDGNFLHRFIPQWKGRGPANGGSFDLATIQLIEDLVVGNRVVVNWVHDGHLRLRHAVVQKPKYPEGIFVGYLLRSSKRWIDVQNIDEGKPWRFYLPWVGGYPSEGGGYDQQILKDLANRSPTDPVRFSWKYKLRPTIVYVYEKLLDTTTPFWVGKKLPEPKRITVEKKLESTGDTNQSDGAISNPFDQLAPQPANPFDQAGSAQQAPVVNPFDGVEQKTPKANPFDQIGSPAGEKKEVKTNPFDGLPIPQGSPFDLINE